MVRTVDPKVFELAELYVCDLFRDPQLRTKLGILRAESVYDGLVDRAAKAMQQALEEEITALREELEDAVIE